METNHNMSQTNSTQEKSTLLEKGFRYVWLNLLNGQFSNSWTHEDHPYMTEEELVSSFMNQANSPDKSEVDRLWKLIKYKCLSDENFEFFNQMKLR